MSEPSERAPATLAARFGHVEVLAPDVEACVRFYVEGLGLEVEVRQGPDAVWLRAGPVPILIRRSVPGPHAPSYAACGAGLVLYTDDRPALLERLAARGIRPVGHDGGPSCPLLRDPAGNWIQLVDPRDH